MPMNLLSTTWRWLRSLAQRREVKREIDEELRFHLDQRTAENLAAGMSPQEAARAARKRFGNEQKIREECRERTGAGRMDDMCRDLRQGARRLYMHPGFTLVAVLSLAVGLALATSTLAVVNAYLLRSFPYPTAHRIYHLRYAPIGPYEPAGMTAIDWKSLSEVVEDTITSGGVTFHIMDGGPLRRARGLRVSPGFLRGLSVQTMTGRAFVKEEFDAGGEGVAIIGHELWRERFGSDPQIVGRTIQVIREDQAEQSETLRIVGVLSPGFWFGRDSSATVDILTPLRSAARVYMVRLREGVPPAFAEQRITGAARKVGSDFRPGWTGIQLQLIHARYVESIRPVLRGITIAVGTVLVLVCANVAVLVLLRAMRRQKELAVRMALGAARRHVVRMLGAEAFLICASAFAIGLVLTQVTLRLLTPFIESQLGRPAPGGPAAIDIDWTVLLGVGGVGLLIALSLAFIPLLTPWQHRLADALRSQGTSTTDGPFMRRLRSSLITFEVAGSLVLLVGCGLMIRSAINLTSTDLGFNPGQVIRVGVRLPARGYTNAPALQQFFTSLVDRLPQDPNSRVALMTAFPPFYPANKQAIETDEPANAGTEVGMLKVGAGYFNVYDVRISQGREFTYADRLGSEPVALVSGTLARKLWPEGTAVGRRIRAVEGDMPGSPFGPWRTVVGVVGDIRQGYDDADLRDIYLPLLQSPTRFASVHVRTSRPLSFWEQGIRTAAAELDPHVLVGTATTIASEDRQRAGTRFLASMLTGFGVFAAFLAVLGIYGVTTYAVQQREREIAIRVAVGASRDEIVRLFLKDGGRMLAAGLALGLCGTVGATRILESQIYGVKPFDIPTLLGTCLILSVAGLMAVWWPARRGAAQSPMMVLKEG
jgi:predicted permease